MEGWKLVLGTAVAVYLSGGNKLLYQYTSGDISRPLPGGDILTLITNYRSTAARVTENLHLNFRGLAGTYSVSFSIFRRATGR